MAFSRIPKHPLPFGFLFFLPPLLFLFFGPGAPARRPFPPSGTPAPGATRGFPSAASTSAAAATSAATRQQVVTNFDANSPFSREQQVALANISAYFNSFRLMEGKFVQIGPNGEQSEGVFFLSRPGKIRFHYNPPSRLDVIADGSSVAIKDGKTNTQDMYPLSKTPLRYLLSDHIDLTSSSIVSAVRAEPTSSRSSLSRRRPSPRAR